MLTEVTRWVGVIVAVVGTVVAAPSGTRELLNSTWQWLKRRRSAISSRLARLLPGMWSSVAQNFLQPNTHAARRARA